MATCCLPLENKSHGHPFTTGANTIYDLVGERLSAEACAGLSLVAKLKCVPTATSGWITLPIYCRWYQRERPKYTAKVWITSPTTFACPRPDVGNGSERQQD
ncbi:hypothetical protein CFAM422_005622 [Trichoderma lentiforme]|uniref:Uncharacterized protein n=1 Tax=Trichoderma lentiforme TaxID=1567552 RepID=A0A9P5CBS9_9HYPO|nr:hypothetical protein CFAM422_005622 [Trichoderma lentiforme]